MSARRTLVVPLLFIVAVGAGLRLYELSRNPPEFFEDEVAAASSAWSIATTGHDVEQTTLPFVRTRLLLQQPVYAFSVVPFWAVLGHTPFAARLPGFVFGIAGVLLIVWLITVLGRPPGEALLAGSIAAVLPWAVHIGRIGWDQASPVPFVVAGVGLLWVGLRDERRAYLLAGAAVLGVGVYTYLPAVFMNCLLAGVVVLIHRDKVHAQIKSLVRAASVGVVLLIPYAVALRQPIFTARAKKISVFASGVNLAALHKIWTYYWWQWTLKGLFSPASNNLRDKPGAMVFWWMLPFLLIGIVDLARRRSKSDQLLLAWLVVGPLPAALTYDGPVPHFSRGMWTMPAVVMVTAAGVVAAARFVGVGRYARVSRAVLAATIAAAALYQGVVYYREYFDLRRGYAARSASWWYYGTGAALRAVRAEAEAGDVACIDGISYFTFAHHITYYFGPHPAFTVLEGLKDNRCRQAGTYVLARTGQGLGAPYRELKLIRGYDGAPVFRLALIEPSA